MKKYMAFFLTVLVVLTVFSGCKTEKKSVEDKKTQSANSVEQNKTNESGEELTEETKNNNIVQVISQEQAKDFIDKEEYEVIIDIRSFEEYNKEHIENAICLPAEAIREETLTMLIPKKDQALLIYGNNEKESKEIAEKISAMGYVTVKSLGTMKDWKYGTEKE